MTTERRYESQLGDRLAELAIGPYPAYVDEILAITERTRRRRAWRFPGRWLPIEPSALTARVRMIPAGAFVIVLLVALAVLAVIVTAGSRPRLPEPFGLASNGLIAFDRGGDIFTVDATTRVVAPLVTEPATDSTPLYSLRGDRLAFFRDVDGGKDLFIVDASGGRPTRIGGPFTDLDAVSWSPDGALIAVGSGIGSDPRPTTLPVIDLVRTDGSGTQRLDVGFGATSPAWRPPDGRQLLFRGQLETGGEFYIVDRDGTHLRKLAIDSQRLVTDYSDVHQGAWSPDGAKVSFNAVVMSSDASGLPAQRIQILDISADGRVERQRQLSFDVANSDEGWAIWSPTGDRFVFNLAVRYSGVFRVAVAPSDGSRPATVIGPPTTTFGAMEHGWSPDEKFILARYWEEHEAWLLDPGGSGGQQVDYWASSATGPNWQRTSR